MNTYLVVDDPGDWPLGIPGVRVVAAHDYLTAAEFSAPGPVRIFNLCRSYRYQSSGYYVSLLALARGHKPLPDITTIRDMRLRAIVRIISEDLYDRIQSSLRPLRSNRFTLSIYFGRNMARRYQSLCTQLFNQFQAPLMRAEFERSRKGWELKSINTIAAHSIPDNHHQFVLQAIADYFKGKHRVKRKNPPRYDLAILHEPGEVGAPTDQRGLKKFAQAAEKLGMSTTLITRDDYSRVAEFDALFIRATTRVNHYTYRFARRASAEGLVVIDDPHSIIRCSNKVFLAEGLARLKIPTPATLIVHKDNVDTIIPELGLPCVLKEPDSAFSRGVYKAETSAELNRLTKTLFEQSDLLVAQAFVPTDFDWRIGILDGQPLYACRYYMAKRHWQIVKHSDKGGKPIEGDFDALTIDETPKQVIRTALRAARMIGNGLYGVDLKQSGKRVYVIEVNDNPSIETRVEDKILGDELYTRIMQIFLQRIEQRKQATA